jgi:hypothetical protein
MYFICPRWRLYRNLYSLSQRLHCFRKPVKWRFESCSENGWLSCLHVLFSTCSWIPYQEGQSVIWLLYQSQRTEGCNSQYNCNITLHGKPDYKFCGKISSQKALRDLNQHFLLWRMRRFSNQNILIPVITLCCAIAVRICKSEHLQTWIKFCDAMNVRIFVSECSYRRESHFRCEKCANFHAKSQGDFRLLCQPQTTEVRGVMHGDTHM